MGTFILIVLLIAALFGVLGAVLKIALVLALSAILATVLLAALTVWYVRVRLAALHRDLQLRTQRERRRREAYDVGVARDEPPPGELGSGSG